MWPDIRTVRVFIRPGATDFRKQINGLVQLVQQQMQSDPLDGGLYVFCSKDHRQLKLVYWDMNGFCLWQKRLERDRFPWPDSTERMQSLSAEELQMLLAGIDFRRRFKKLEFKRA